jgi:cellulose synthase/poly-beta-1,6-N-acetylglucosamine synthase-like glycosyltransferase
MLSMLAATLIGLPVVIGVYAYVVYPFILWIAARLVPERRPPEESAILPVVSITVPAYNAESSIAATLDHLLRLDYPRDRLQLLVVSDASTDGTDAIVRGYAPRGVELLRMPVRRGKTAAENAAAGVVRGEIVVNVDASILVPAPSLRALVRAFDDPSVGVASGRDLSAGHAEGEGNGAESGYVGYEMWVRSLETRLGSIIGASGCFYGIRRSLLDEHLPESLSWDFASALVAHERGLRSVSVDAATCIVPRTRALQVERQRKVRTMARGVQTLWYKRHLMNPLRHGAFAFMLVSHKMCRWLPYLLAPFALAGLAIGATLSPLAGGALAAALLTIVLGGIGLSWRGAHHVPRIFAIPGFLVAAASAGMLAWWEVLRHERLPMWEPTPRPGGALR